MLKTDRIILGIDPGTTIMGYGLIHNKDKKIELITLGILKLNKYDDHPLRLRKIFERTLGLIEEYKPDEMSLEAPFYGKNVQSMLKLGRAQGVAMAAGLSRNLPIFEYSPRKIKQAITGKGNASKEQVSAMLCKLLNIKEAPQYLDASDGLAAAVCHYFQQRPENAGKKYSGWKAFLKDNPEKIERG
ncbi:MAG: crossover junction endodeoxyribonuclease RuvC [Bacteroidales bacterium]|nr:crossover junction endodeoxyribonuclease RuvC [Bacteroidales bacterium]MCF8387735.1 crossover junction endodeoxyribonuclease RuvC [Bacteroidales bacterium]MCF8397551.1 crossover junction endodeoxyribonuclease RuvC [Bacteroidales bacterium]